MQKCFWFVVRLRAKPFEFKLYAAYICCITYCLLIYAREKHKNIPEKLTS